MAGLSTGRERASALLIVDVQRDFCPRGALPVGGGDEIIRPIKRLVKLFSEENLPIIFTRDWHPVDHSSFRTRGGMWPPHCVRNTKGAEFHPSLEVPDDAEVIDKATEPEREAYSGFDGTRLGALLRRRGVRRLFVAGLATDYCVKKTVTDGIDSGFETYVIADCVRGVNLGRLDSANAFRAMLAHGAKRVMSKDVLKNR